MTDRIVKKGETYYNGLGARVIADGPGLVVCGHLIYAERMAAALNAVGGYGKVKRRSEAHDEPTHPSGP